MAKRNRLIVSIIAAIVIIGAGVGCYSYASDHSTTKPTTVEAKATTSTADNNSSSKVDSATKTDVSASDEAQIKKMEKGYFLSKTLGYINPIYKGYNPNEIVPGQNIIKSAESYAVPANEVAQMVAGNYKGTQKEVFLTIDDGPSANNTPKILQILKNEGVHATFFVIGDYLKSYPYLQKVVREELMDGNAIGDHTFDHEYSKIYPHNKVDVDAYMKEEEETKTLLTALLGPNFDTRILRMPGGYMSRVYYHDPNLEAFNKALDERHLTAIDWTAETGDAESSGQLSINKLLDTLKSQIDGKNQVVVLVHDSGDKVDTVKSLPALIEYFKQNGYQFKVIENAPASSFNNLPLKTNTNSNQGQA